jgi:hypothetical protein
MRTVLGIQYLNDTTLTCVSTGNPGNSTGTSKGTTDNGMSLGTGTYLTAEQSAASPRAVIMACTSLGLTTTSH